MNHPRKVIKTCQEPIFSQQKKHLPTFHTEAGKRCITFDHWIKCFSFAENLTPKNSGCEDFQLHAKKKQQLRIRVFERVGRFWLANPCQHFWQLVGWIVCQVGWVMLVRQFDVKLHSLKLTASLPLKIGEKNCPPKKNWRKFSTL